MRFGIRTLDEFDLAGKTVLCRVDINQPVDRKTGTLKSMSIPFTYEPFEQEHVQPFRSREDAKSYFLFFWNRLLTDEELDVLLDKTSDAEFPYQLVTQKKMGLIVFDAANPALKKPIA